MALTSMREKEMLLELYEELRDKLLGLASVKGISQSELQKYFIPEAVKFKQSRYFRLASSLQNSWSMGGSIKFYGQMDMMQSVLCAFDAGKVAERYADAQELYEAFLQAGVEDRGSGKRRETNWMKFVRGLFDGAHFLAKDDGGKDITRLIRLSNEPFDFTQGIGAIRHISGKIHGLGFALTCDWLKESGCTWLAKPDVHIDIIVRRMKADPSYPESAVIRFIFDWAELIREAGVDGEATAYKLDKMLWLLCTEKFYLDNTGSNRDVICRRIDEMRCEK